MGTPTITWDATFDNSPAGSDDPRAADDRIRELKLAAQERAEREHGGTVAEASARHGVHRLGSARAFYQTGDPATAVDGTGTRTFNVTDDPGRLFVDKTTKQLKFLDDTATPVWNPMTYCHLPLDVTTDRLLYSASLPVTGSWTAAISGTGVVGIPAGAKMIRVRVKLKLNAGSSGTSTLTQICFSDNSTSTPTATTGHPLVEIGWETTGASIQVTSVVEVDVPLNATGKFYIYSLNRPSSPTPVVVTAVGYY